MAGRGKGIVLCTGARSKIGELFRLMSEEDPPKTPLQKSMDTLGKQLSAASLAVIAVIMAVGCLQGRPVLDMFNVGVSLAVAAIPEVGVGKGCQIEITNRWKLTPGNTV